MITCPKCGAPATETIESSTVLISCSKCSWAIARSWTESINEDETEYRLTLKEGNSATKESLAAISKAACCNYIAAKQLLSQPGKIIFCSRAPEMKKRIQEFGEAGVLFEVSPDFPY